MILIEHFFYETAKNYREKESEGSGWSILLTRRNYSNNRSSVFITLIDRSRIKNYLKTTNTIDEIIVVNLKLFSETMREVFPEIELVMTEDIKVISHLLFSHFKMMETSYLIDAAISMVQRKSFKKNEERLKSYFEIFELIFFIQANLNGRISIDSLAKHMNMSTSTIRRFCIKTIKKTPIELVRDIRIAESKNYLENTDLTIDKIAYMVGFQQSVSFYSFFRESVGKTPNEYRQHYKSISHEESEIQL